MKFAASRSLWHGRELERAAARARSGRPSPSRPRSRAAARTPRSRAVAAYASTTRNASNRPGIAGPAWKRRSSAGRLRRRHPSDLALDEARDEVALRLEERDHLRPDPERGRGERGLVLDVAVDPEQPGVLAADPQHERLAAGAHLEVVVRDPAAERLDRLDAAGPDPLDDLVDHARMRSPAGSKSGSAATSPATHSPKISTSTGCPGCRALRGQVGVGDRALDRVAVAAARDAADRGSLDANRLRAERDRARVGEHEAAEAALRLLLREQRLAADEVALVELDREPEPRLERRVVGRDVGAPDAVALLEPQRVDRPVAARDEAEIASRLPDRIPEREPELGRAVELPAELADVGDAQREARHGADGELARPHVREVERRRRQRLEDLAGLRAPEAEAGVRRGDVLDGHALRARARGSRRGRAGRTPCR